MKDTESTTVSRTNPEDVCASPSSGWRLRMGFGAAARSLLYSPSADWTLAHAHCAKLAVVLGRRRCSPMDQTIIEDLTRKISQLTAPLWFTATVREIPPDLDETPPGDGEILFQAVTWRGNERLQHTAAYPIG